MQKQHLFMCPFYYIDYAVSRVGALEYYGKMQEDLEGAWKDYYALCSQGGSKGYHELLRIGNLSDPFKEGTIYNVLKKFEPDLSERKLKKHDIDYIILLHVLEGQGIICL